jgi:hypothetical protein
MQDQDIAAFHGQRVTVTYTDHDLIDGDLQPIGDRTVTGEAFWISRADGYRMLLVDDQHLAPEDIASITADPPIQWAVFGRNGNQFSIALGSEAEAQQSIEQARPELRAVIEQVGGHVAPIPTRSSPRPCPHKVWVPVRGRKNLSKEADCPNRGTVPIHWGPERTMVCESCADELTRDDYLIQVCRLPNAASIRRLTAADRDLARAICARIAGAGGVKFTETDGGLTATIRHWGRQHTALRTLRKQGFQALQPSDNPTVRIVGRTA